MSHICTKECQWDSVLSPALWLAYISAISENIQSKNNIPAILDELSIHSTKKALNR